MQLRPRGKVYYAYDMKKRALGGKKKYLFIIGLAIALLAIGGASYWYFVPHQQQQKKQLAVEQTQRQAAAKEVESLAFKGDRDLATDFVQKINTNDPEGASKVYLKKIDEAKNVNEKLGLYNQYLALAYEYDLNEQALQAALAANELESNYLTLSAVAYAYKATGDSTKEIEYLERVIAAIDTLPQNENMTNMKQNYQSLIDAAQERE